jgi:hypothetical protein
VTAAFAQWRKFLAVQRPRLEKTLAMVPEGLSAEFVRPLARGLAVTSWMARCGEVNTPRYSADTTVNFYYAFNICYNIKMFQPYLDAYFIK